VGLARGAFKATEQVLVLDPSRKDAAFFTGSYRYAVANLGSVKRWLAYLAGFSGDRELAVRMIEESAAYPSDVQADARILLVLVYNKERRYGDACACWRVCAATFREIACSGSSRAHPR